MIENNEKPQCDIKGTCPYMAMLFPDTRKPFKLYKKNKKVAEIFRRTIAISDRKQYTFYKKKNKEEREVKKFIPTLSHLDMVLDNYSEFLGQGERSDIISKIGSMYKVFLSNRLRA